MKHCIAAMMLTLIMGTVGCAAKQDPNQLAVRPLNAKQAEKISRERNDFERRTDPPLTAETRFAAGQLAEAQKAYPQAVQQYREALKLNRDHTGALYRLGVLYAQFKQYPDAITAWQQYIKATRDAAVGYSNLGFCYELAGRPDDAEATYRKGIERDSESGPCRINYGLMLARHGRTNEAIIQLQTVLSPAEVRYNLASVYEAQGKLDEARAEYRKAVRYDPRFRDAHARLDALE